MGNRKFFPKNMRFCQNIEKLKCKSYNTNKCGVGGVER